MFNIFDFIEKVQVQQTVYDAGCGASFNRGAAMMKEAIVGALTAALQEEIKPAALVQIEPEPLVVLPAVGEPDLGETTEAPLEPEPRKKKPRKKQDES